MIKQTILMEIPIPLIEEIENVKNELFLSKRETAIIYLLREGIKKERTSQANNS